MVELLVINTPCVAPTIGHALYRILKERIEDAEIEYERQGSYYAGTFDPQLEDRLKQECQLLVKVEEEDVEWDTFICINNVTTDTIAKVKQIVEKTQNLIDELYGMFAEAMESRTKVVINGRQVEWFSDLYEEDYYQLILKQIS